MKVKVGDNVYTSAEQPIMVILAEGDKNNITNMHPEATRYAEFSDDLGWSDEEKIEWMKKID